MNTCKNCKTTYPDSEAFCSKCGLKLMPQKNSKNKIIITLVILITLVSGLLIFNNIYKKSLNISINTISYDHFPIVEVSVDKTSLLSSFNKKNILLNENGTIINDYEIKKEKGTWTLTYTSNIDSFYNESNSLIILNNNNSSDIYFTNFDLLKENIILAEFGTESGVEPVTFEDVDNSLKTDIDYLIEQYGDNFEQEIDDTLKEQLKSARETVLENLIDDKIIAIKVDEFNLISSKEELDNLISEQRKSFVDIYGGEDALKQALEYYGMSDESFINFITNLAKRDKLQEKFTENFDDMIKQWQNELNVKVYKELL